MIKYRECFKTHVAIQFPLQPYISIFAKVESVHSSDPPSRTGNSRGGVKTPGWAMRTSAVKDDHKSRPSLLLLELKPHYKTIFLLIRS